MRRTAVVLAPVTFLAGAIFACQDDPDGFNGPTFELDGGTPGYDASTAPDAPPDAPPPPPAVTVKVVDEHGPQADVRVVFHDANGEVLETKLTGADGKATSVGALPAMASALIVRDGGHEIVTWTGLEDGDELAVHAMPEIGEASEDPSIGSFAVTAPPTESSWTATASDCSGEGSQINLYRNCAPAPTTAVRVTSSSNPPEFAFAKGITVPTDGGVVPVSTGEWTEAMTVDVNATNSPDDHFSAAYFIEIADGYPYTAIGGNEGSGPPYYVGPGFADALQASFVIRHNDFEERHKAQLIAKRVPPTETIDIDLAQVLPKIEEASVGGESVRRPEFSWTGNTANTDGGIVRIRFGGIDQGEYHWTLVVPPGSSTVKAPALPTEAASFLPAEDAIFGETYATPHIVFVEADFLSSYKEFRQQQGSLVTMNRLNDFTRSLTPPPMPVNGTVRATAWNELQKF
ncbi:MAG TPA: hypothetical protein VM580_01195 [Labilithrix sp.]|nr:hypothetical protein [Labilithrix sp.]